MIRVYQVKYKENTKKFVIEDNGLIVGDGVLKLYDNYIEIEKTQINQDKPFQFYDLLIRSMLNIVRDLGDMEIKTKYILENKEESSLYQKLGFIKNGEYYTIKAKDINFRGSCGGNK